MAMPQRRVTKICACGCGEEFETGGRLGRADQRFKNREHGFRSRYRRGSRSLEMTEGQAAYLAGLVDGEGSIIMFARGGASSWGRSYAIRVVVAMTRREPLEKCAEWTGVGTIQEKLHDNPNWNTTYTWYANAEAAESILRQIRPFMTLKGEQADLAVSVMERLRVPALKADRAWQEEYRLKMQSLNARGSKRTPQLRELQSQPTN